MSLNNEQTKKRFLRLENQLAAAKALLETHPLTSDRLLIVQNALHFMHAQSKWSLAGSLRRLLITIEMALIGYQTNQSVAGFVGPSFDQFQQGAASLMVTTLGPTASGDKELLKGFNCLISCGCFYLMTKLGNWKDIMPLHDMGAAKKGGWLFRELSLIFLVNSHFIDYVYRSVAEGFGLDKRKQKIVSDIGLFQILVLFILLAEEKNRKDEELIETLKTYLMRTLDSVQVAVEQAYSQHIIEEETFKTAGASLQLLELNLKHNDLEALQQILEDGIEALGLSYEDLIKDLKQGHLFCQQLDLSLQNILEQTETTHSHVDQMA